MLSQFIPPSILQLEEFRKKKAAERAKKAASTSQTHASDVSLNDKLQLETEHVRVTDSDGAGTSDGPDSSSVKIINSNRNKTTEVSRESQQAYSNNTNIPSFLANDYDLSSTEVQMHAKGQENEKYGASWNGGLLFIDSLPAKHMNNDLQEPKSKADDCSLNVSAVVNPISSEDFVTKISPQNSLQSKASEGSLLGSNHVLSSFYEGNVEFINSRFEYACL